MLKKELITIKTDSISPNPFQPRKNFDEESILELSESIKQHGIINPIIVRKVKDSYQLVSGERRLRASKEAGISDIPAILIDIDGVVVAEVSLIENLQRKDLNCIEEALAYNILKRQFGLTQEEIAVKIGKSRPYITNTLRLLDLPQEITNYLIDGKITAGHGRALLSLPTADLMNEVLNQILRDSLSVRQTEKLVQDILSGEKIQKKRKQNILKSIKDVAVFYNAIKKTIKDIKQSGGRADLVERETEDYFEILVRIPKDSPMINE